MKDFIIMWFIDCSHRDENVTMVTKPINDSYWFLYDCISAEMEERSLINMGPHYGSLVINIPMQHECKKNTMINASCAKNDTTTYDGFHM